MTGAGVGVQAPQQSNFSFLTSYDDQLVRLGLLAERFFVDDPNTCLLKLRQFGELLAQQVAARLGILDDTNLSQADLLARLNGSRAVDRQVMDLFHGIRRTGNQAAHELAGDHRTALNHLKYARELAVWFHRTFGDPQFKPGPFLPPRNPESASAELRQQLDELRIQMEQTLSEADKAAMQAEQERLRRLSAEEEGQIWAQLAQEAEAEKARLAEQLAALQREAQAAPAERMARIAANAVQAAQAVQLDEAGTRALIDQQLRDQGWEADSVTLSFAKGARPAKGRRLAIAEWPTENGRADYVLFDGLTALAVVEAKRRQVDVAGALEQAKRYSRSFLSHGACELPGGPWGEYRVPFCFATNGRGYLQQLRTRSGIWFCDVRRPDNLSRPMDGWYAPADLIDLLRQDMGAAAHRLDQMGFRFDFPLRDYQIQAIRSAEQAIVCGERSVLLAMATGTGKTKTAIALLYRLLKAQRFRRVLFLVDRAALGEQAAGAFKDTKMESLQTFADIFGIKELDDIAPDRETKVHIATVQGMVRRLLYAADAAQKPSVGQYDCLIVDECHRGYLLDRELSDTELVFRDERDYISKYRRVLDYFDAVKIGLTATPALHTSEIFGVPVYTYSYREAVLDGYLVDHDPPVRIETELSRSGIGYARGDEMELYNVETSMLEKAQAPDEVHFDVDDFNKKVLTEAFNRVVCEELARQIDPGLPGKTLVFCATDAHADLVVDLLKQAFRDQYGSIDDDAVKKITGASDKPLELIRRYKNEQLPKVAVTVDLLTTGIDVPDIVNLVFLRRVNSRILYEQMIGRATRQCPDIEKDAFRIFDAVGLYEKLAAHTDMKPVVVNPSVSFSRLIEELSQQNDPGIREQAREQLIGKLQRKRVHMSEQARADFETAAGMPPEQFIRELKRRPLAELASWLSAHPGLGELLDRKGQGGPRYLIVSHHDDRIAEVSVGYGKGQKPEDYLKAFEEFVRSQRNELPALLAVLSRPRELTRAELKRLVLKLESEGFNERSLQSAYAETSNQEIAARIIGFIRQAALGDPLVPYEQRVDRAVQRLQERHSFTPVQRNWLKRIAAQMKANLVVDRQSLDHPPFSEDGGFRRLDKIFDGRLEALLAELTEATVAG